MAEQKEVIRSAQNTLIKEVRKLLSSRSERRERGLFVVEGITSVRTLLGQKGDRCPVERLLAAERVVDDVRLWAKDMPVVVVDDRVFESLSDTRRSQGVLALARWAMPDWYLPDEGIVLLVDHLTDPGNLGTLIRSAVGAAAAAVWVHGQTVDPTNPKVVRAAMGAHGFIDVMPVLPLQLIQAREAGWALLAARADGARNVFDLDGMRRAVLCIGSESHGLCDDLRMLATETLRIPLAPGCESLNAAVAGSICLFHLCHGGAEGGLDATGGKRSS